MMSQLRTSTAVFLFTLLGACSGGSNNSGESPLSGQFIDSAVSGLRYATVTRSGVTDSAGTFEYLEGETVSFYLGDLLLGDADGAEKVSLFDLVEGATPVVGGELRSAIWDRSQRRGYGAVINMATLLQTLDTDGVPENGIEISPDVAALFSPDSVDFSLYWQTFDQDRGFMEAMSEAKSREFIAADRQVRKPWRAMAHVYASLGVDDELRVKSGSTVDRDNDGTTDSSTRYVFDAQGRLSREEVDTDGDGMADDITTNTYDANGNLIRYERDYDVDGNPDYIGSYYFDADGNRSGYARDRDADGQLDSAYKYIFDVNRRLVRDEYDRFCKQVF